MEQLSLSIMSTHLHVQNLVDMHDGRDSSLRNISHLPTELLCRIFLFARWAYETDPALVRYSQGYLQWIQACSHVSQHWRRIAINYPMLWTNPPLHLPQLTDVMLQRSETAPLSLALDLNFNYRLTSAIATVTRRGPQVRSLEIWCSLSRRNFTTFLDELTENFTILEELVINRAQPPYPTVRYSSGDDNHKNVDIYEGRLFPLPTLRKLVLNRVNISWNSEIFGAKVTALSIANVSSSARFNAEEFKSMLGYMPNLNDLCIINACRHRGETSPDGCSRVQLAKLNMISLGSSPDEIAFVFDNVEIPPTLTLAMFYFDNSQYDNPANIDLQLHRWLSKLSHPCWSPGSGQRVVSIYQNTMDDGIYDFVFTTTVVPHRGRNSTKFAFGISIRPGLHDHEQVLAKNRYITEALFKQLQSSNLYSLSLDDDMDIPSDTLAATFGTLQHLAVVYAHGPCAHSLIEAMHKGYNDANTFSIPDSVPFPALRQLGLKHLHFDDWLDRNPVSLGELQICLTRRREWDRAIRLLELESCRHMVPGELFERRELLPEEVASLGDLVDSIQVWGQC